MTPAEQELERQADELLKPYSDVFSEIQLKRQERRHHQPKTLYQLHEHLAQTSRQSAFFNECAQATLRTAKRIVKDRLTLNMIECRIEGWTQTEIALHFKCSQQCVSKRLSNAAAEVKRRGPYFDLYDVIAEVFGLDVELVILYCRYLIRG